MADYGTYAFSASLATLGVLGIVGNIIYIWRTNKNVPSLKTNNVILFSVMLAAFNLLLCLSTGITIYTTITDLYRPGIPGPTACYIYYLFSFVVHFGMYYCLIIPAKESYYLARETTNAFCEQSDCSRLVSEGFVFWTFVGFMLFGGFEAFGSPWRYEGCFTLYRISSATAIYSIFLLVMGTGVSVFAYLQVKRFTPAHKIVGERNIISQNLQVCVLYFICHVPLLLWSIFIDYEMHYLRIIDLFRCLTLLKFMSSVIFPFISKLGSHNAKITSSEEKLDLEPLRT